MTYEFVINNLNKVIRYIWNEFMYNHDNRNEQNLKKKIKLSNDWGDNICWVKAILMGW
jgi:hypothetical protein